MTSLLGNAASIGASVVAASDTSLSLLEQVCVNGDTAAWDRLIHIYAPLLNAWLHEMGVQSADADDLVQEILLTLSCELKNFEHNGHPGAFRSWLRRMLVNRARNFWRIRQARPTSVGGSEWAAKLDALADDDSSSSRAWDLDHDRKVIELMLIQIRPRFASHTWEAFHRQVLQGQRANQVAAELGMPISSVYVSRSRVLNALRIAVQGLVDEA